MMGVPELRKAVAAHSARNSGIDVDWATETLVTSGATEALACAFMGLLNPGDEVRAGWGRREGDGREGTARQLSCMGVRGRCAARALLSLVMDETWDSTYFLYTLPDPSGNNPDSELSCHFSIRSSSSSRCTTATCR